MIGDTTHDVELARNAGVAGGGGVRTARIRRRSSPQLGPLALVAFGRGAAAMAARERVIAAIKAGDATARRAPAADVAGKPPTERERHG